MEEIPEAVNEMRKVQISLPFQSKVFNLLPLGLGFWAFVVYLKANFSNFSLPCVQQSTSNIPEELAKWVNLEPTYLDLKVFIFFFGGIQVVLDFCSKIHFQNLNFSIGLDEIFGSG